MDCQSITDVLFEEIKTQKKQQISSTKNCTSIDLHSTLTVISSFLLNPPALKPLHTYTPASEYCTLMMVSCNLSDEMTYLPVGKFPSFLSHFSCGLGLFKSS